jgi:aminoglycoside phosphotransferase (APT) family kinase protein
MTDVDPRALLQALGVEGSVGIALLSHKRGKSVWRVDAPAGTLALRVRRPGEGHKLEREQAAMRVARAAGLGAPDIKATAVCDGVSAMLLAWLPGRDVHTELYKRPWAAYEAGLKCGRWHAALHQVEGPNHDEPWVDRFGDVDPALRERVLAASGSASKLLHLDFIPQNIIGHSNTVTGVVDWSHASSGDPRADVARTWALLVATPRRPTLLGPGRRAARAVFTAGWERGYAEVAGLQEDVPLFRAWALAALLNFYHRQRSGTAGPHASLKPLEALLDKWRVRAGLPPHPG